MQCVELENVIIPANKIHAVELHEEENGDEPMVSVLLSAKGYRFYFDTQEEARNAYDKICRKIIDL